MTNRNTTGYKSLSPFLSNTTRQLKVKIILADFTVSITFVQNNFIKNLFITKSNERKSDTVIEGTLLSHITTAVNVLFAAFTQARRLCLCTTFQRTLLVTSYFITYVTSTSVTAVPCYSQIYLVYLIQRRNFRRPNSGPRCPSLNMCGI